MTPFSAATVARRVQALQPAAGDPSAAPPPRSMQHHEDLKEVMRLIKKQAAALARVEGKVNATLAAIKQSLTAVLGLVNDDCRYPRTFLVLPKKSSGGGWAVHAKCWRKTTSRRPSCSSSSSKP